MDSDYLTNIIAKHFWEPPSLIEAAVAAQKNNVIKMNYLQLMQFTGCIRMTSARVYSISCNCTNTSNFFAFALLSCDRLLLFFTAANLPSSIDSKHQDAWSILNCSCASKDQQSSLNNLQLINAIAASVCMSHPLDQSHALQRHVKSWEYWPSPHGSLITYQCKKT